MEIRNQNSSFLLELIAKLFMKNSFYLFTWYSSDFSTAGNKLKINSV